MDLLINAYGTRIRSSGERIVLAFPRTNQRKEYPIRRIEKIIVLRPSSISMGAVQLAIEHGIDIVYLGSFGKPVGRIFSSDAKGIAQLRRAQLEGANSEKAFILAREFVKGKVKNQIDYLEFLQKASRVDLSQEIIQAKALFDSLGFIVYHEKGREQLFGVEGYIADKYFSGLKKLYPFSGRKPQARDKFNSVLNYGYGILYNEIERACLFVGLDPFLGLYHSERYGKPALVLDLIEEFRVPIVDSTLFPLFMNREMEGSKNFKTIGYEQYELSTEGKGKVVGAIYERLNKKILWDEEHREIKKCIEHQVRALAHYFLGEQDFYIPFSYQVVIENHE